MLVRALSHSLPASALEQQSAAGAGANAVSQLFSGEIVSTLTCPEAPEEKLVQTETFTKLMCHITKDTNFLINGLKEVKYFF